MCKKQNRWNFVIGQQSQLHNLQILDKQKCGGHIQKEFLFVSGMNIVYVIGYLIPCPQDSKLKTSMYPVSVDRPMFTSFLGVESKTQRNHRGEQGGSCQFPSRDTGGQFCRHRKGEKMQTQGKELLQLGFLGCVVSPIFRHTHLNFKEEFYAKATELNIVRLTVCVSTVLNSDRHCVHSQMLYTLEGLEQSADPDSGKQVSCCGAGSAIPCTPHTELTRGQTLSYQSEESPNFTILRSERLV